MPRSAALNCCGKSAFTLRHLGTGVARGLIAALIILPPTYIFSIGIDALYTRFHYIHPTEHQLLKAMSDTQNPGTPLDTHPGGGSRRSVVRRIPVPPPPHSNTHPARLGSRCYYARQARDQFPRQYSDFCIAIDGSIDSANPRASDDISRVSHSTNELCPRLDNVGNHHPLTSCLFALVHEMWMWPPIFFLSLGLGYCYRAHRKSLGQYHRALFVQFNLHLLLLLLATPMISIDDQIRLLSRRCERILSEGDLRAKLKKRRRNGKAATHQAGNGPNGPRRDIRPCSATERRATIFQDWGHKAVLIIGDYTARVSDVTGRSNT